MTKKLLMGNEAMAHAALEAGVRVVAGYPGTPSSEIVETVARERARGAAHGVHVEWSTNEKVALELLFGASLAGARGLFTCKQMGLNVASDALLSLNYVSVRGGLVLIVADDPGPISSQTEQDTRRFAAFAKVPVLDPATPEQAYHMVKAAFDLSERFQTPVIVRPTTRVDHSSAFLDIVEETYAAPPVEDGFARDPSRWVIFPKRAYQAHGEIIERLAGISRAFSHEPAFSQFNPLENGGSGNFEEATFGIVAGGISASYTREALRIVANRAREAGFSLPPCRFLQVGTPYPFPEEAASRFVAGLADVLVIEELDHVLEDEFTRLAGRIHVPLNVHGKLTGEMRERGENDVDDIVARLERFLGLTGRLSLHRLRGGAAAGAGGQVRLSPQAEEELPERPPVLCAGCPHRGAFYAVKQALEGADAVLCGDIGCYTLGNARPLEAVDTCLCMGGGITMAQGIAVADPGKKAIAYVGDSTFFASGMPGLANAAYNGHDITVMVLDNATTAMTGSQPHPGTGVTLMSARNEPLDIESVLIANGFSHIYHVNPFDCDSSTVAVRAAIAHEGPSAVIFEGPCIQLVPPERPVEVNHEACTGCKRCITSIGCPAISFNVNAPGSRSQGRGQAVIDTALCTGCRLCIQMCPFKAIHVEGDAEVGRPPRRSAAEELLTTVIPANLGALRMTSAAPAADPDEPSARIQPAEPSEPSGSLGSAGLGASSSSIEPVGAEDPRLAASAALADSADEPVLAAPAAPTDDPEGTVIEPPAAPAEAPALSEERADASARAGQGAPPAADATGDSPAGEDGAVPATSEEGGAHD